MDRLNAMRVFVNVVDSGSLSAAADKLDMSRPVVTRYVAELEQWTGARLLHRTTRRLSLTAAGEELLPRCRQVLELTGDMQAAVRHPADAPREQLRITAGSRPGSYLVHVSLLRAGRADSDVGGTLILSLDGTAEGQAKSLDFAALTGGRTRELRFNFRYLQALDQELNLPPTFKPEQLQVEVRSTKKDVAPVSQSFLWTVDAAP